jgi:hypothetical protein
VSQGCWDRSSNWESRARRGNRYSAIRGPAVPYRESQRRRCNETSRWYTIAHDGDMCAVGRTDDPGFEVAGAIRALFAWLVERGAPPTGSPWSAATDHIAMHDNGPKAEGATGCAAMPCPTLGVSWGLYACLMYERECSVFGPWIEFATCAELAAASLGTAGVELLRTAAAIQQASKVMHDAQGTAGAQAPTHPHDLLCVAPATMAARVTLLVADLEELANRLRGKSLIAEFQRKPGPTRPARELLTCVWQHLHLDGGLKYAEVWRLVPDRRGGTRPEQDDRVKKRVKRPDVRWRSP